MRPRRTALTAAFGLVLLAGCTSGGSGNEPGQVTATPSASPTGDAATGGAPQTTTSSEADGDTGAAPTLLDVTGRSLDGGEIDLGDLTGEHLVLWMWAPW